MRRIELFLGIAVAVLTAVAIGLIVWVPVATDTLITPFKTTVTHLYAFDLAPVPTLLSVGLFVALAALLMSSVLHHTRQAPTTIGVWVAVLGVTYAAAAVACTPYVGGAADAAGIAALICSVVALIPSRRLAASEATAEATAS